MPDRSSSPADSEGDELQHHSYGASPSESWTEPPSESESPHKSGCHITIKQRIEIQTLHRVAHWSQREIAERMNMSQSTISNAIRTYDIHCPPGFVYKHPNAPQRRGGRQPVINAADRLRLVTHATLNAENRLKPREQIAAELGIVASSRVIAQAFKKEGYKRYRVMR
jgi:IS30 family transposase